MGGIHIDGLVQREGNVVSVEGGICAAVETLQGSLGETSDQFLNVANTLGGSGWVSRAVDVPELKVCRDLNPSFDNGKKAR